MNTQKCDSSMQKIQSPAPPDKVIESIPNNDINIISEANVSTKNYSESISEPNSGSTSPKKKSGVSINISEKLSLNPDIEFLNLNTLYNLPYKLKSDQILKLLTDQGEIYDIFYNEKSPGKAMVFYYDIRCAQTALQELNLKKICNQKINLKYVSYKTAISFKNPNDLCLSVILKSSKSSRSKLTLEQIKSLMSKFGEIQSVIEHNHMLGCEFF